MKSLPSKEGEKKVPSREESMCPRRLEEQREGLHPQSTEGVGQRDEGGKQSESSRP